MSQLRGGSHTSDVCGDDDMDAFLEGRLEALLSAQRLGHLAAEGSAEIERIMAVMARGTTAVRNARRSPQCVLMSGMPGSGKTHLALALANRGMVRLCPDEEMFRRYGRYGPDFPRGEFRVRERPVLEDIGSELQQLLAAGLDVVVDHGFWTPEERQHWSNAVTQSGGVPLLVYLPVPHEVRWSRIQARNAHSDRDPNAISFSEEDLLRFAGRFLPPTDQEPHIRYSGTPEDVLSALAALQ